MKKFFLDKRLIMLYGNHDIFKGITPYESLVLKQKSSNQKILVVHGHQGDLMNDQLWPINMFFVRYFWRFMHLVGFQNPSSPARNHFKRHRVERNYKKWIKKHKMMLICGHTHRPKFPKLRELPYFNTGCCIHTRGFNGIEIVNNKIMMVDWRVQANKSGNLQVVRSVMRGPIKLGAWRPPS